MRYHRDELHRRVEQLLAGVEQRYTSGRQVLVDILARAERPMSIAEVLENGPRVPMSSAYRNLKVLEDSGAVRRIVTQNDHAVFELGESLVAHHHHLICTSCGAVDDIEIEGAVEEMLANALDNVAKDQGFEPSGHTADIFGTCQLCQ